MTRMARGAAAAAVGFLLALALGACHHSSSTLAVAPAAPTGVVATAGDTQVTLSWGPVKGATGYDLYWSPSAGVTPASGTKIAGVTSPYTQTGLTDGTTYYYVVTAVNAAGESGASIEVTATPQVGLGSTPPPPPAWTWVAGSQSPNQQGVYTTPATPGGREGATSWADSSGNLWLFGGLTYDSTNTYGNLNDLWKFDGTAWTWVTGSSTVPAYATYNSVGATGMPGGRNYAASAIDSAGNLWLFGGYGYDTTGSPGDLNDLWEYSPSTGTWTWVAGGNTANQPGYDPGGLNGVNSSNVPGSRVNATLWADASGNIWLFGGDGFDQSNTPGFLNDLWEYVPGGTGWIFSAGSASVSDPGLYGPQGAASTSYKPSARDAVASWADSSNGLWIFGGTQYDGTQKDDLWRFNISTDSWAWEGGGKTSNATGVYGVQGTAAPGNVPGGRNLALGRMDASGNVWLFGGYGYDSGGTLGALNDLWEYDGTNWTWVAGSQTGGAAGIYGTQGTGAPSNTPGSRSAGVVWLTGGHQFWIFGGYGTGNTGGSSGELNDLWRYGPLP